MKTRELTERALDYAVALAEGYTRSTVTTRSIGASTTSLAPHGHYDEYEGEGLFAPSTGPAGDDIIDRVLIDTLYMGNGIDEHYWRAECIGGYSWAEGTTRREAAMRAYVLSKLGDEVEIPKELQ